MTDDELELILHEAGTKPLGLVLRTNDVNALRQKLYRILKKVPDAPALALTPSRTADDELLVVRKDLPDAPD